MKKKFFIMLIISTIMSTALKSQSVMNNISWERIKYTMVKDGQDTILIGKELTKKEISKMRDENKIILEEFFVEGTLAWGKDPSLDLLHKIEKAKKGEKDLVKRINWVYSRWGKSRQEYINGYYLTKKGNEYKEIKEPIERLDSSLALENFITWVVTLLSGISIPWEIRRLRIIKEKSYYGYGSKYDRYKYARKSSINGFFMGAFSGIVNILCLCLALVVFSENYFTEVLFSWIFIGFFVFVVVGCLPLLEESEYDDDDLPLLIIVPASFITFGSGWFISLLIGQRGLWQPLTINLSLLLSGLMVSFIAVWILYFIDKKRGNR